MKVAIIGAGITGLVAGYRLLQAGHEVTIFEKEKELGGLLGSFKIEGRVWRKPIIIFLKPINILSN